MAPSLPGCDFAVVGGGIVGACVAEELAHAGATVVVADAGDESGHATPRAAGVAVPSLRYLPDPEFYAWLTAGQARLRADIARLTPGFGAFSVARPVVRALRPADLPVLERFAGDHALGTWVSTEEAAALLPGLGLPADRRYLRSDDGLIVNGARYLAAARAAGVAAGVDWRQGIEVLGWDEGLSGVDLRTPAGAIRADQVVLAAGAWSGGIRFGAAVPVYPLRGQLVRLDPPAIPPCILSSAHYLAPDVDGRLVVGATEEDAGFDARCTASGVARLLRFAVAALPVLGDAAPVDFVAGLRPASRTGYPVVGRLTGTARVFVASGHGGFGLLSARYTAEGLVAGLTTDDWESLPEPMCPSLVASG